MFTKYFTPTFMNVTMKFPFTKMVTPTLLTKGTVTAQVPMKLFGSSTKKD